MVWLKLHRLKKEKTYATFFKRRDICAFEETVSAGGYAALWLGNAYVSWYPDGDARRIDLRRFDSLDSQNGLLFTEMLTPRKREEWNDEDLFRLEQEVKQIMSTQCADND